MTKQPRKLRGASEGKPLSELTKLKAAWLAMSEPDRDKWRALFMSATGIKALRGKLLESLDINLTRNEQLCMFKAWDKRQLEAEAERENQKEDERRIIEEFGDQWTFDQIRREVLRRSYERTLARGDFKQGLATIREDARLEKLALDTRKVDLLEKKAQKNEKTSETPARSPLTAEEKEAAYRRIFGMA